MKKRIAVVGSANIDIVLTMPKAPSEGETVTAQTCVSVPGGKGANRAVALGKLGANPLFSCCLGNDGNGKELLKVYDDFGVDCSLTDMTDEVTGSAYIYVEDGGNNRIVVYPGANGLYGDRQIDRLFERAEEISMLNMEFEIPVEAVERVNNEAVKRGIPTVIDAGPVKTFDPAIFKGAYIFSPNQSEAKALTGITVDSVEAAKEACGIIYGYGVKNALIKMGELGSICYDGRDFIYSRAVTVGEAVDTTAAGDCYMAALCKALCDGASMQKAMDFAGVAAGISVTRRGAIPSLPILSEIKNSLEYSAK